jgi:hypothetical protein
MSELYRSDPQYSPVAPIVDISSAKACWEKYTAKERYYKGSGTGTCSRQAGESTPPLGQVWSAQNFGEQVAPIWEFVYVYMQQTVGLDSVEEAIEREDSLYLAAAEKLQVTFDSVTKRDQARPANMILFRHAPLYTSWSGSPTPSSTRNLRPL